MQVLRQGRIERHYDPERIKPVKNEGKIDSFVCVKCEAYASKSFIDGHATWRCKLCQPEFFVKMKKNDKKPRVCLGCNRLFPSAGIQNRRCDRCKSNEKEWL